MDLETKMFNQDNYERGNTSKYATDFHNLYIAAGAVEVIYHDNSERHVWEFEANGNFGDGKLSEWADTAVRMLKIEPYALWVRTILDVIFCDRVYHDHGNGIVQRPSLNRLPKVELSVGGESDGSLIQAEADWCLVYGHEQAKADPVETTLVILQTEELWTHSELPRLIIYLAAIQNRRRQAKKADCSVFGLIIDSRHYTFVLLDGDRNLFVSETYSWVTQEAMVIRWIDRILRESIEVSAWQSQSRFNQLFPSRYSTGPVRFGGDEDTGEDEVFEAMKDGVWRRFRVVRRFAFGGMVKEVKE